MLWFNHAAFFHITTLEPTIQATLTAEFAEEDLPETIHFRVLLIHLCPIIYKNHCLYYIYLAEEFR